VLVKLTFLGGIVGVLGLLAASTYLTLIDFAFGFKSDLGYSLLLIGWKKHRRPYLRTPAHPQRHYFRFLRGRAEVALVVIGCWWRLLQSEEWSLAASTVLKSAQCFLRFPTSTGQDEALFIGVGKISEAFMLKTEYFFVLRRTRLLPLMRL
jgi:hypothetical protein